MRVQPQIDLSSIQDANSSFAHLSLLDLVTARDLFHVHLMRHPNVAATAIGRYRIRVGDSWPNEKKKIHGTSVRRLDNSEVRPYPRVRDGVAGSEGICIEAGRNGAQHHLHAGRPTRPGLRH